MSFTNPFLEARRKQVEESLLKRASEIPSTSESEWRENTPENPFWKHDGHVEVELSSPKYYVIKCPKCARDWMGIVKRWRTV